MYLLPGNPFSHAVEAYRDSGEGRCASHPQHPPAPFICHWRAHIATRRGELGATKLADAKLLAGCAHRAQSPSAPSATVSSAPETDSDWDSSGPLGESQRSTFMGWGRSRP